MPTFFLNLPHAATVARRIEARLKNLEGEEAEDLFGHLEALLQVLGPYAEGQEPDEATGSAAAANVAAIARRLVDEIERLEVGEDRLGQAVRNLFECLGMPEEGLRLSLRAGEDPRSLMRPASPEE